MEVRAIRTTIGTREDTVVPVGPRPQKALILMTRTWNDRLADLRAIMITTGTREDTTIAVAPRGKYSWTPAIITSLTGSKSRKENNANATTDQGDSRDFGTGRTEGTEKGLHANALRVISLHATLVHNMT